MGLKREKPKTEELWVAARQNRGIGASEAAAVVGLSPWMTSRDLWEIKCGLKEREDLSGNPLIEQGHRMEGAIRELYKAYHPDYKVTYHPYDLLYQSERPWLFATLDGEIVDDKGRHGILEVKTSSPITKADWNKWDTQVPPQYFIQILHQMLATGWDFVDLIACLINQESDFVIRTYSFERSDFEEDLTRLLEKEEAFWQSVQKKVIPPLVMII